MQNIFLPAILFAVCAFALGTSSYANDETSPLAAARKQLAQGLPKDALETLRPFLLDAKNAAKNGSGKDIAEGVIIAANCMRRLNKIAEMEDFLENVLKVHQTDWRAVRGVITAWEQLQQQSYGSIVDNKFLRGQHSGRRANAVEHDRIRILQLYTQAVQLAEKDTEKTDVALLYLDFAKQWNTGWRKQVLSDFSTLPDYDEQEGRYGGYNFRFNGGTAAPVDEEGNPVLYNLPETFEKAKNDGERWRWCLAEAAKCNPALLKETLKLRAEFALSQFGEHTLQGYDFFRNRKPADETDRLANIWNLESLKDNEVIAKTAIGIKRFELSDEFHYIALYKQCDAWSNLAQISENRMQYEKAVSYYEKLLAENVKNESAKNRLAQITGNWGRFDTAGSDVKGAKPFFRYVFRNGSKVNLTATEIKIPELLNDIKEYLKSKPQQIDWQRIQIEQIGYNLIFDRQKNKAAEIREKYLGSEVAAWNVPLQPAEKYYDDTVQIDLPIKQSGAFLVKAAMENGNTQYAVVWLTDTAIVQKQLDKAALYYIADAQTGKPLENVSLDFFGYRMEQRYEKVQNNRQRQLPPEWFFREFSKTTDKDGFVIVNSEPKINSDFSFLITAKTTGSELQSSDKRFAYFGFSNIWFAESYDEQYNEVKAFFITDRPVYRPGDTVKYKFWAGTAKYDQPEKSDFSNKQIDYVIYNPKGEETKKTATLDNYGGYAGELTLPKDCPLGVFNVSVYHNSGGSFRVEEYKKPEYEVLVDAPKELVKLGEKFNVKINAKYYFGAPVTEASVKYKVIREKADESWYPVLPWDWFYGTGYGWFAYDTPWLDGFYRWGCCRPVPSWSFHYSSPEVIAEAETKINADGTVDVPIDTSLAKALFPDDSQRYSITAEVIDSSRRTITGSGSVLVTKEPFKVYAWTDKGHYIENQKVAASFQARRLDGKPVSGNGEIKLFKLAFAANSSASETLVHSEKVQFKEDGTALLNLNAAAAGQYKISCTLDGQEGGYVFNVYQSGLKSAADSENFQYNALELIPDKTEYKTGEQVQLRINSNRKNAAVVLFLKPANGIAAFNGSYKPQLIRLNGKSQLVSVPVELRDMPNFFIEALSVSDGGIANEIKEIVVPPVQKVLNVDIKPSSENYKPGEKAKAVITVADLDGKPVVGQTVVSIYDKSVEYISDGSNVADIKEFFWKWRRHHHPQSFSNLDKYVQIFGEPNKPAMQQLGIFGNMLLQRKGRGREVNGSDFGGGIMLGAMSMPMAAAAPQEMAAAAPQVEMKPDRKSESNTFGRLEDSADISGRRKLQETNVTADVQPTVRKNFADTALWVGALETDKDGKANIELTMPESLTTWKINVWDMSSGTRVGYGTTEVITKKNLILRMQTPRFLVEKDKCIFSANVHNYLASEKEVKVELNVDNLLAPVHLAPTVRTIKIPANGESRIDWEVEAKSAGDTVITMKALTDEESDAMEKTLPVYVHGILKQEARSGYIAPDKLSQSVEITVPAERKPEQTKLTVRFSPTLAASMIDALPYLTDYPYGCTEQTLNRFLPTVIVKKILTDMNIDLAKIKDIKTNLNAQELGKDRKTGYVRTLEKRNVSPVFDAEQVTEMVRDGVTKLTDGQNSDGGWGWFSGDGSHSSAHLTALTVHGLRLAKANDVAVNDEVINRGIAWLQRYQENQVERLKTGELPEEERKDKKYKTKADDLDAFVYMVLSEFGLTAVKREAMKNYLWRDRGELSLYAAAMFGIALSDDEEKETAVVKIIEQYLVQDSENQTAYLDLRRYNNWCWWSWYGSEFETQAYYLKLLMRTNPKSPIAPQLVKYLLNNRRHATHWNSTRDTAIIIEAFAEFIKATGEDKPDMTVDVLFDGQVKKSVKITPENLFEIDNTLVLSADEITTGKHTIELRKRNGELQGAYENSRSPLYFNTYLENFSLEDPLTKAGLEVKIERRFYKLERDSSAQTQVAGGRGQVVDTKIEKYKRIVPTGAVFDVQSGDLIEVELLIESKNDYESILIEDRKAAGLEPVNLRSGYNGNELGAYVEFRDERTAFFVEQLSRGKHSLTYRLRAEQPGKFSALPAKVEAMYAPELKGNSDENKVNVADK